MFALLGDAGAARGWLVRSHADASETVRIQTDALQQVIEAQVREAKRVLPAENTRVVGADVSKKALMVSATGGLGLFHSDVLGCR
jgi:hypothetical protein